MKKEQNMQINNNNPMITLTEVYDTNHWVGGGSQAKFQMGDNEYMYTCTNPSPSGGSWQTTIYRLRESAGVGKVFDGPAIYSVREKVDFNTAVNAALGLNG